ncbi:MAG TPA: PadR family transcriptional regulator [Trebonia sp.]|jgi:DNA-binding PadR family transcriptional regulator|nr:PadR family transcriptional regulator [Trebonia sp.]
MTPVFRHGRLRLYLLRLLDEEPRHGYEVIRLLRDRFMGVYAPSPGTIYPRLARLEDEGLVTHDEENGRKVYRITEAGREELRSRGAELDELEEELSESVSDIAREFGEDVRATVRSLREELTRAAREVRQTERDTVGDAAEAAREAAEAARELSRGLKHSQAKDGAWTQARDARERARQARDEARSHAQRLREEAAQLRVDAREQWTGWTNWSEWSHWTDRPGRAHDLGALRDFERLAREFVTDLRSVAWDSSNVLGSEVIPALRDILSDTLDRIRTEVLGPMNNPPASPPPPPPAPPAPPAPPTDGPEPKDS